MSASQFTRTKYDNYTQLTNQSTKPLNYQINNLHEKNMNPDSVSISVSRPMVDIESDLKNIHRKINATESEQYIKGSQNSEKLVQVHQPYFQRQETRSIHPPSTLRGTGWFDGHVYQPLHENPQKNVFYPDERHNMDTKRRFKDNYRPRLCVSNHSQTNIIQNQNNNNNQNRFDNRVCVPIDSRVCGVFTDAMNPLIYYPDFRCEAYKQ